MSEPMQNPRADELDYRITQLLEQLGSLFIEVRELTADSCHLRNPELSMEGVRAGVSLSEAESHLKNLQRGLRWATQGILPRSGAKHGHDEPEDDDAC